MVNVPPAAVAGAGENEAMHAPKVPVPLERVAVRVVEPIGFAAPESIIEKAIPVKSSLTVPFEEVIELPTLFLADWIVQQLLATVIRFVETEADAVAVEVSVLSGWPVCEAPE